MSVDADPIDYVVYGTVAWDRPWLTEHNLAHALAKTNNVLYVEPPISPLTPIRYGIRGTSNSDFRRLLGPSTRRIDRHLTTCRLVAFPPLSNTTTRRMSVPLIRWQVARTCRRRGLSNPVVLAFLANPEVLGAARERAAVYIVKDFIEAGAELLGAQRSVMVEAEARMLASAQLVCAVTPMLRDSLRTRGVAAHLLPHGFHADLAPLYDSADSPREYDRLPRPLLVYAGRIDERLDFQSLLALAEHFAHGSIVLIGPVSPRLSLDKLNPLALKSNVYLLGARARLQLPPYLRHADCLLMPYRGGDWTKHGSPLKLWDYFYAGPPPAGSGCVVLRSYDCVYFADPPTSLVDVVEEALAEDPEQVQRRRQFALNNTWDDRASALGRIVAEFLADA